MGVGGRADQGLWITTRAVYWDPLTRDLTRISEVGVIAQFGTTTVAVASQRYRTDGLDIGMQFRAGHQVGTVAGGQANGQIEFAVAMKELVDLTTLQWTPLAQHVTVPGPALVPGVTETLRNAFSTPAGSTWRGYRITPQMFAAYPAPPTSQAADERLYFRIVIRNFTPHSVAGQWRVNDVHIVSMVCLLTGLDFATHYVLGIGAFTVGHGAGALQFDSQVIAKDVPQATQPSALPAVPPARRIQRPDRQRPPRTVPTPPVARPPRPPRPGPPPPVGKRRRTPPKRRKR